MKAFGEVLDHLVRHTIPRLEAISETDSLATRGTGTWSRRQILGHLIDSGTNNLHRFIRAQQTDELVFPGYDQPFWVDRNGYEERPWASLVQLWAHLNLHLAHVIVRIPADRSEVPCKIGEGKTQTLGFIVEDYVRHLRHHLDQILEPDASKGKMHARWG
jgi:hypothetical protein